MKRFSKTVLAVGLMASITIPANAANMPDNVRVLVDEYSELAPLCRSGHSDAIFTTRDDCKGFPRIRDSLKELGWCYDEPDETKPLNWRQCKTIYGDARCRTIRRADEAEAPCAYIPKAITKIDMRKSAYSGKKIIDFVGETWEVNQEYASEIIYNAKEYNMKDDSGLVETLHVFKEDFDADADGRAMVNQYFIDCSKKAERLMFVNYYDKNQKLMRKIEQFGPLFSWYGIGAGFQEAALKSCGIE